MTVSLASLRAVETALFVRIDVPGYDVLRFSNYYRPYTINGESYTGLGTLVGITNSDNNLRAAPGTLTITISGIPNSNLAEILDSKIKGSNVQVWRVFFDPVTGQPLDLAVNPIGRFQGIVNNYSLDESWEQGSQTITNTMGIICSSTVQVLNNKISGRRTNSTDQKRLYPTDTSMDRVAVLATTNFNFGAQ